MDDTDPEIPTTETWRGIMVRARKSHGMTQEDLGKKVGLSQVMISKIETGSSGGSSAILRICNVLSIPLPEHFSDDRDRHWAELGHVLRDHPEQYDAALHMLEVLAKQVQGEEQQAESSGPERPERRK